MFQIPLVLLLKFQVAEIPMLVLIQGWLPSLLVSIKLQITHNAIHKQLKQGGSALLLEFPILGPFAGRDNANGPSAYMWQVEGGRGRQ